MNKIFWVLGGLLVLACGVQAQGLVEGDGPNIAGNELPLAVGWSPDGEHLAVSFQNTTGSQLLRVYETVNWTVVANPESSNETARSVEYSPDGQYLALGIAQQTSGDEGFVVYRVNDGAYDRLDDIPASYNSSLGQISWSSNSGFLLSSSNVNGSQFAVIRVVGSTLTLMDEADTVPSRPVTALAFHPQGGFLTVATFDEGVTTSQLMVYRFVGGKSFLIQTYPYLEAHRLENVSSFIEYHDIKYSPQGDFLLTVGNTIGIISENLANTPPPMEVIRVVGGTLERPRAQLPIEPPFAGGGGNTGWRIGFDGAGGRLCYAGIAQPPISAYVRAANIFLPTARPEPTPEDIWGNDCAWSPNGTRLASVVLAAESDFFNLDGSTLIIYEVKGELEPLIGGLVGTGDQTIITLLISGVNAIFGFDGTTKAGWILGVLLIVSIMAVFRKQGENPLLPGIGAATGMAIGIFVGFTPLWLLLVTIVFAVAFSVGGQKANGIGGS
jgi:hypothetical protein